MRSVAEGARAETAGRRGHSLLKCRRRVHGRLCPAGRADQRHERDRSEILLVEAIFAVADDLHQLLGAAKFTDRDDQTPADLELAPQSFRNFRPSGGDQDGIKGRGIGPSQSPVAMPHFDIVVFQLLQRPSALSARSRCRSMLKTLPASRLKTAAA